MQSISLKVQSDHCSRTTRPNSSLPIVSKFEIDLVIDQLTINFTLSYQSLLVTIQLHATVCIQVQVAINFLILFKEKQMLLFQGMQIMDDSIGPTLI